MFPNLRAEMARKKITNDMLAEALGINPSTMSAKLNAPGRIKLAECIVLIDCFFPEKTVDELFRVMDNPKAG